MPGKTGIKKNRLVRYENDSEGCALNFEVVSDAIVQVRKAEMSDCEPMLSDPWSDRIHENYKSRKKRFGKKY